MLSLTSVSRVRNIFLVSISAVYLMAFSSLYLQIPGLYGNNGILPARLVIQRGVKSLIKVLQSDQPTLLRLFPLFGLNTELMMDFLCIIGMLTSSLSLVFACLRCSMVYLVLWFLYFSLYQVGETFLSFQWDILLLEVGVLTIIVAPLLPIPNLPTKHNGITLWLVKWLLFRLMFASGVVKLQSHCPTWWGLTALSWHFESQCIPTPLSYYMHHLPSWLLKLGVVQTYVTQIGVSFLFFSPLRSLRMFAFWAHVSHQVLIMLTGNYNFFNIVTIALALPLLDDSFFHKSNRESEIETPSDNRLQWLDYLIQTVVYAYLAYVSVKYFSLDRTLASNIAFSKGEFERFVETVVPITIWMGVLSLGYEVCIAFIRCIVEYPGVIARLISTTQVLLYAGVAYLMFAISLVPHTNLDRTAQENLPHQVKMLFTNVHHLHISSSYGLFRRMTGVGGRPEVIVEGSYDPHKDWIEYDFLYKPGNLSTSPPFVAPHQPRLDWQMWFAALGSYHHNPWFLNLCYRLLTNQREVLDLLPSNPFLDTPPTYIRARLFHYHYTDWGSRGKRDWWKRDEISQYFPVITKDDANFVRYLQESKIIDSPKARRPHATLLTSFIHRCRLATNRVDAFLFIVTLLTVSFLLNRVWFWFYRHFLVR